jgi:hypothetical protein
MATKTAQKEDHGLLSTIGGHAPSEEEITPRVHRIKGKHILLFWGGTALALGIAAYIWHATKYKFESRRMADYMENGTQLVYALGYLIDRTGKVTGKGGEGVPLPPEPPAPPEAIPSGADLDFSSFGPPTAQA